MGAEPVDLPPAARALIDRFSSREAKIGVVGLGYVGLPLAVALAQAGFEVIGVDLDPAKVEAVGRGESYVPDVPASEAARVGQQRNLQASGSYAALGQASGISVSVPTPLRKTGDPDLSFILAAVQGLKSVIHEEMVIILESTTYPGTARELVLPGVEATGLKAGVDVFLAFSPERVDPGRDDWTTRNTPKVVGGVTPAGTEAAAGGARRPSPQAVRLHEIHARAGAGRSLHPDRSAVSLVEAEEPQIQRSLHRTGQRDQHPDAPLRRAASAGCAQRSREGGQGGEGARRRGGLQARGHRPAGISRPGCHGAPAGKGSERGVL